MDYLNWVSDHWCLVISLALIASGTITVPKMWAAFCVVIANR